MMNNSLEESSTVAQTLVARFDRMVRRDGGSIALIDASSDLIRISYRPGTDETCVEGVCIMPEAELHAMMSEVLAAQAPGIRLQVVRASD